MKVLIFGAGSVGQIYGYHLTKGGAEVSYYIRPKYREQLKEGFTFYPLKTFKKYGEVVHHPVRSFVSTDAEVAQTQWDYVLLCVASDSLHSNWLESFLAVTGKATIVSLLPGDSDMNLLLKFVEADRLIRGLITLIGFHAPLPGEKLKTAGTAYWFPPFLRAPFSGKAARLDPLLKVFRQGGFPCVKADEKTIASPLPSTVLLIFVAGLEAAGWKFNYFFSPRYFYLFKNALLESLNIIGVNNRFARFVTSSIVQSWILRVVDIFSRVLVPFDLELYLQVHFTKVQKQGRMALDDLLTDGIRTGANISALEALRRKLK